MRRHPSRVGTWPRDTGRRDGDDDDSDDEEEDDDDNLCLQRRRWRAFQGPERQFGL